jgi:hypothetical protein
MRAAIDLTHQQADGGSGGGCRAVVADAPSRSRVRLVGRKVRLGLQPRECGLHRRQCRADARVQHPHLAYSDGKVANRDTKVWHGATENGL